MNARQTALNALDLEPEEITIGLDGEKGLAEDVLKAQKSTVREKYLEKLKKLCDAYASHSIHYKKFSDSFEELNNAIEVFKVPRPLTLPPNFPEDFLSETKIDANPNGADDQDNFILASDLEVDHDLDADIDAEIYDDDTDEDVTPILSNADEIADLSPQFKTLPTMVAKTPATFPAPLPDEDKGELDAESVDKLYRHYKAWSWLAEGSWGELEQKVPQIKKNCAAIYAKLGEQKFQNPRLQNLRNNYNDLTGTLYDYTESGLSKTYLFCNEKYTAPASSAEKDQRLEQLNTLYASAPKTTLDVENYAVCFVGSGEYRSAFVQGTRSSDKQFISEAHLSNQLSTDMDKLREFVFNQIESFHADPRNVGKIISFQGNYSKQFLELALQYCNLRDYAWEVTPALQKHVLAQSYVAEKANFDRLFKKIHDVDAENSWNTWLTDNNKKPFRDMLDKETVKLYEKQLALEPLKLEETSAARDGAIELAAKNSPSTLPWELPADLATSASPPPPSPSDTPPHRDPIIRSPTRSLRYITGVTFHADDRRAPTPKNTGSLKDKESKSKVEVPPPTKEEVEATDSVFAAIRLKKC